MVSVLFCDLVGFTAASEAADPEDVRARLRPYHANLRQVIDSHGGTVEKFAGDAVMAVFGAPLAHEDDPERAVRAGLRILERLEELNQADEKLQLQVRVGINTGEAVVGIDAHPERGEGFVAGDVVNTASRLQTVAPVNAVVVSEATFRRTERVFRFVPLERVQVKGKAEPLEVWRAVAPRARFGADINRAHATPLVGRDLERPLLITTFERAMKQRACELITLVGEPGVGKTRLCTELLQYLEHRPGLVRWRQGHCLPYGEGVAFWGLGEVVKAQCGILDSDSPEETAAKLDEAIPADEPDRAWLKARLAPLVGAGGEPATQEESFTAWRRFLVRLAAENATVLVFEDLHWADDGMLAFIEHLADWSEGVPLLLLCTARPELQEQHPTWAAGLRNAHTINLAPLSDDETATLITLLLDRMVLPAATHQILLERAGGNPLYAEEFVRLLSDRRLLAGAPEVLPVPDTLQALIAARLDTLAADRKSLLQDAAVVGRVFWAGAVAAMGKRDPREVDLALHDLIRKELVRPTRTSSMQGEQEYAFWHLMVRDVCYAQIPRPSRVARHRGAAVWIEAKAGERIDDLADVLAHHYVEALDMARASGLTLEVPELEAAARRCLALAGIRALAIDVSSAQTSLARALELTPVGHPERARLLERWAQAAQQQGRLPEAKAALEEALALYRDQGATIDTARALTTLSSVLRTAGDPQREWAIAEALRLLDAEAPGPELVAAHAQDAAMHLVGAAYVDGLAAAERALELASNLHLPEPAQALGYRGGFRAALGQQAGLADVRRALALAVEQGMGREAAVLHNNLAFTTWQYEGPSAALERCDDGIAFCERRGVTEVALAIAGMRLNFLAACGRSDEALAAVDTVAERAQAAGVVTALYEARSVQLSLLGNRGETAQANTAERLFATARETQEPQMMAIMGAAALPHLLAAGLGERARALLVELERTRSTRDDAYYAASLPQFARCAVALDDPGLASRLTDGFEPRTPLQQHALATCRAVLAEAAGNAIAAAAGYADAASRWRRFGDVPELAFALLGRGRSLTASGVSGANDLLEEARGMFASMGYATARNEADTVLRHAVTPAP